LDDPVKNGFPDFLATFNDDWPAEEKALLKEETNDDILSISLPL
jgi:hypothetical protein